MKRMLFWLGVISGGLSLLLAACGDSINPIQDTAEPTLQNTEITEIASLTPTLTLTPSGPSLTPSSTFPPTVTDLPTDTPIPPESTAEVVSGPPPFEYQVREGDTCGAIALRHGLDFSGGSAAIAQANGVACNNLSVGARIVIPRATGTATPQGYDITQTAIVTALPPSLRNVTPYAIATYCPVAEDTLTSIALKTGATQLRICEMNPLPDGLDCSGCDFSESAAVGYCPRPPLISEFKCIFVPGPTLTPSPTPTFTGSETPTSTPTYAAPRLIQPLEDSTARGRVILTWLSIGELETNEWYKIEVVDEQTGERLDAVVKYTSYTLPDHWIPAGGQSRSIVWKVEVVSPNADGIYIPVGARGEIHRFVWEG